MKPNILTTILCSLFTLLIASAQASDFSRGVDAYHESDYVEASEAFEAELSINESAAARHNLALSLFQQGKSAQATWQLEQAIRIAPLNENYLYKLGALRQQMGLFGAPSTWWLSGSQALSQNTWIVVLSISFWTLVAILLLPSAAGTRRSISLKSFAWLSLLLMLLSVSAIYLRITGSPSGVIVAEESTTLRHAPAIAGPEAGIARPGERARIVETYRNFYRIETEAGITGWVSKDAFGLL